MFAENIVLAQPDVPRYEIPSNISKETRNLIIQLYSSNPVKRRFAVYQLGKINNPSPAIPFLIGMLGDDSDSCIFLEDVSRPSGEAIISLAKIGKPALDPLIKALRTEENRSTRINILRALGKMKDEDVLDPVINSMKGDSDKYVRANAAEVLGKIGDKKAVEPLLQVLKNDNEPIVRQYAAEALGNIRDKRAVESLVDLLAEKEEEFLYICSKFNEDLIDIQGKIIIALGNIGDKRAVEPLINYLNMSISNYMNNNWDSITQKYKILKKHPKAYKRSFKEKYLEFYKDVIVSLGKIGDKKATKPLIENLDKYKSYTFRRDIIKALGNIGDEIAALPLIMEIKNDSNKYKKYAAIALGKLDKVADLDILIDDLKNGNLYAAQALGSIGDERAVEPLISALRKSKSHSFKVEVVKALGKLGDKRAAKPLIDIVIADNRCSEEVALALGRLGDIQNIQPLVDDLKNGNPYAAQALGTIGDKRAVEPLLSALLKKNNDETDILRQARFKEKIILALGKIGDPRAEQPLIDIVNKTLNTTDDLWKFAADSLGMMEHTEKYKDRVGNYINKYKNAPEEEQDLKTINLIGRFKDPRAVDPLIKTMQEHYDIDYRIEAIKALGRIGDKRAINPLIDFYINGPEECKGEIVDALKKFNRWYENFHHVR